MLLELDVTEIADVTILGVTLLVVPVCHTEVGCHNWIS